MRDSTQQNGKDLLLRRLLVFHGGVPYRAIRPVCIDQDLPWSVVKDLLEELLSDGTLRQQRLSGGLRLFLFDGQLEELRADRVWQMESAAIRARHQRWYLRLVQRLERQLRSERLDEALNEFFRDRENIYAAMDWAMREDGDPADALAFVRPCCRFWQIRNSQQEGIALSRRILRATGHLHTLERSRALEGVGMLHATLSHLSQAERLLTQALAIARELGDRSTEASVLANRALVHVHMGRIAMARREIVQAVDLAHRGGNPEVETDALRSFATVLMRTERLQEARDILERVHRYDLERGDLWAAMHTGQALAEIVFRSGVVEEALSLGYDALQAALSFEDHACAFLVLLMFSRAALRIDEARNAAVLLGAANFAAEVAGSQIYEADLQGTLEFTLLLRERLTDEEFDQAWSEGHSFSSTQILMFCEQFASMV